MITRVLAIAAALAALVAWRGVAHADDYTPEQMDQVVAFCQQHPENPDCQTILNTCRATTNYTDNLSQYVCPRILASGGGGAAAGAGFGTGGDDDKPLTQDDLDKLVAYCRTNAQDASCQKVHAACANPGTNQQLVYVCNQLGWSGGGGFPSGGGGNSAWPGGGTGGTIQAPAKKPTVVAGLVHIDFRMGFVDDETKYANAKQTYSAFMQSTLFGFDKDAIGAGFEADLGSTSDGGFLYRADLMGGLGKWVGSHAAVGLFGGVGVNGITGGRVPFALDVPVRLVAAAHVGDRLTLMLWGQTEWNFLTKKVRQHGSPTISFADAVQAGATIVLGRRSAANEKLGTGWSVGGLYQEQDGAKIASFMIGFGQAQNPWNAP
jgi:hypothetical protein